MKVVSDSSIGHVNRRYSNKISFANYSGDYPTGVFEQLACKEAELDMLKQRERKLALEIASLKINCQRDIKAG
ncbi:MULTISPECIES: hypothetical protein [unclassified Agarivorans]|uniref:hypothetical protein n=1 Tax=unclassified Agarivorans TaxID=2636026 RepID=UPI003D7EDB15